jgi:uncharacterized protein YacL
MESQILFFLINFVLWIYLLDECLNNKENKGFLFLQFGLSIPLIIFIANNSYINSFVFGYIFAFIPMLISIYVMVNIFIGDKKKNKK